MKKQLTLMGSTFVLCIKQTISFLLFAAFLLMAIPALAQQTDQEKEAAFKKVLTERSAKIVSALEISKKHKKEKITSIIAEQYFRLNKIHDDKSRSTAQKTAELEALHQKFISRLNKKLNPGQVEKVKNGMTYNVLNVTYTAYQDMILTLSEDQKSKIYAWLVEAREKAMMEGSSDAKHKVFGKYKGRINNYLSEQGYNMKAEEKAWQQRLREKREKEAASKKQQGA